MKHFRLDAQRWLQLALLTALALALGLATAQQSRAGLDTWPTGNGQDGAFTDPGANGALNYSAPITGVTTNASTSTITTGAGRAGAFSAGQTQFKAGRLVLVIQSSGYPSGSAASGDQGEIDLSTHQVGQFEIARINTISGSLAGGYTFTLTQPLDKTYAGTGAQIVSIPEFTSFTISTNRSIGANAWDGDDGGITAFVATGAVTLGTGAAVTATGAGFRGGALENHGSAQYCTQIDGGNAGRKGEGIVLGAFGTGFKAMGNRANGAGGGNCENAGGGGGGNGGYGGRGGKSYDSAVAQYAVGGLGGQRIVYSPLDHAIFGGGGGSGDENNNNGGVGSPGGGLVFIRGSVLAATGATISANGVAGGNSANVSSGDGAGGGGAGGVVHARFSGTANCGSLTATGGNGGTERSTSGNHGPGGGGGGGRVYFQSAGGSCATSAAGGARGVASATNDPRDAGPGPSETALSGGSSEIPSGAMVQPAGAISIPAASATVAQTSTFSGTSTALSTIRVYIDGTLRGTTISDGSGNWVFSAPTLAGGAHSAYVIPIKLGIAGDPSSTRNFSVDATPPVAPVITTPSGNISTNNPTPTISGTAEANSTVSVLDGATVLGTAPVNASGNWSFTVPIALDSGAHSITAFATDPYSNAGPASSARTITVDLALPAVTISAPAASAYVATTTPAVAFSANEAGTATCQIDSGSQVSCSSPWTATSMSQGQHTVTVRWTDAAGNVGSASRTFTVDTVQPAITILSPATNGAFVSSTQPAIGFSISDANAAASSQCRADSGSFASCQSPWTSPSLAQGAHSVEVRHTDLAGNIRTESRSFVVDTTAPSVAINQPANGGYSGSATPSLDFTVSDTNPGTSYCQVDGGAEVACSNGGNWPTPLSSGQHTLAIRHVDAAGNSGASASSTFTVDTTLPVVAIQSPTNGSTVLTTSPQVDFTVSDQNAATSSLCAIDSSTPTPCTSPFAAVGLSQGSHTVTVTHVDLAGNSNSAVATFAVDSLAPAAPTFLSSPSNPTNQSSASFGFSAAEVGGHLECQLDGGSWSTCTSPRNFTSLTAGAHSFLVRQVDGAGNVGDVATYNWQVDTTAPPAPNVSGPSGVSGATNEVITFYNAEQGVTFTCQLDSQPAVSCTSPYSIGPLSDGAHTLTVVSTDAAGNSSAPTVLNWTTDAGAFSVAIDNGPVGLSGSASGSFFFSSTVDGATFYCSLDGATAAPCSPPFNYSGLADSAHSFSVYAEKESQTTATVSRSWTIDSTAPSLTVSSPAAASTSGAYPAVQFSASDAGGSVSVTCKLDSAPAVACTTGHQLANLSNGSHTVTVTATDLAGNSTAVARTWTVDKVAPDTTITSSPSASTTSATADFEFVSNESPSSFECRLDGGAWAACTSPRQVTVSEGTHNFSVRAVDGVGNIDPTPASFSWVRDTSAPAAPSITSDPELLTGETTLMFTGKAEGNSDVKVYFNGNLMGGNAASSDGNWFAWFADLEDGTYTVRATATDAAGNVSPLSNPVSLTIDTAPPTVQISGPAEGALVNSPNVSFSGSDAASDVRFECEVDDLTTNADVPAYEQCYPPLFSPTLVSNRQYQVTVRAIDELENYATAAVTFNYDSTPPARPTITTPAADTSTSAAPVTIGGAAESGSVVTVYVDGTARPATTAASGGSWSYTFSPDLAEQASPYSIHVVARDAAGNDSLASLTRSITVDRTAPAKPVISSPAGGSGTNNSKPPISGTAEAGSTLKLTIDLATVDVAVSGGGTWTYTPPVALTNGSHTLSAKAVDAAGNQSPVSDSVSFTVDNQPPSVGISSPASGAQISSTSVTAAFTATDNDAFTLVCKLDGDTVSPCATPSKLLTGLGQGGHSFAIQATDVGGNVASASVSFTVDTVAPAAPTIVEPSADAYFSGTQVLVSGAAESAASVQLTLSSGPSSTVQAGPSGSWSKTFNGLADGTYSVTAVAIDAAGNTSPSAQRTFTIDNAAPSAPVIDTPTDGAEMTSLSSVSGHGAEPGATVDLSIGSDGGSTVADLSGNWSLALSPAITTNGDLSITARQSDRAGNPSAAAAIGVRIDSTAPVVAISSPAASGYVTSSTPSVTFSVTDASSAITRQCRVSTGSFTSCTSPWTAPTLGEGSHTVEVRATDGAGNQSTQSVTFTVDTIAPETQFSGTLPGQSAAGTVDKSLTPTFAFSSPDGTATFRCSIDNGPYVVCTSPRTLEALTNGSHTFRVRAVDAAGNQDATPAEWTWTVDSIAPAKPVITDPLASAALSVNKPPITGTAEPLSTVTVRVDGSAIGTTATDISGNWSFTPSAAIADGPRLLTATATDAAQNISPLSTAVPVTIDAVDPAVTITGKPASLSNDTTPNFDFEASEDATFRCSLDSPSYIACGSGFFELTGSSSYQTALSQGAHTFKVIATDRGGRDSEPEVWSWSIDSIAPPKPTIGDPVSAIPATVLTDTTPAISGTAEAGSEVNVYFGATLVGSTTAAVGGGWSVTSGSLADGSYTAKATATDSAGNVSVDSDPVTFVIDTTAPVGSVSQQAGSGQNGAKPVFLIASNDLAATYKCSIDGSTAASCTSPYTPAQSLAAGVHTLVVTFTDSVGNASQQSLQFTATSAPPAPTPVDPVPTACFPKGVTITDLAVAGSKVKLTGYARLQYAGQPVEIYYRASSKKPVARSVVGADGSFSTSFKAPAKKLRASKKSAYNVKIGSVTTAWTQLTRRMATTTAAHTGGRLTIKGAVTKPLFPKATATINARTGCAGAWTKLGSAKINASGKFSFNLSYTPVTGVVFVKVDAVVGSKPKKPKKIKTSSFVIPVVVK